MDLPKLVANVRYWWHLNAIDTNNVLNQLHIRSDDKAEECAKKHVMTIVTDILPRLGYDTSKIFKKEES